jgi:circadian clock protein KaiC
VNQGGERNRALTVVKSRGTGHSNQVRELILSDEGITLSDVYSAGGSVLMGTLRWEKETADRQKQAKELLDQEHREREAKLGVDEIRARMTVLTTELALHEAALERLRAARLASADQADAERRERLVRRRADSPSRRSTRARPTP